VGVERVFSEARLHFPDSFDEGLILLPIKKRFYLLLAFTCKCVSRLLITVSGRSDFIGPGSHDIFWPHEVFKSQIDFRLFWVTRHSGR
jgi:hypothetical protein